MRVSTPKGVSVPSCGSEQAGAQKLAEPCTFGGFQGRIRPLREVEEQRQPRVCAGRVLPTAGALKAGCRQASLTGSSMGFWMRLFLYR